MGTVLELALDLLVKAPTILSAGMAAFQSYQELVAQLQQMHADGRDPTPAERDAIKAEVDALEQRVYAQKP